MADPIYYPQSVAAGVKGPIHQRQGVYRGTNGHVMHPAQMTGDMSSAGLDLVPTTLESWHSLGDSRYPAAPFANPWPPVVPIQGGPNGKFNVG
jgi:hypothetical protein